MDAPFPEPVRWFPRRSAPGKGFTNTFRAAILVVAAVPALGLAAPTEKITYQADVLPILRNSCLNCHNPDKHKAGLDMTTYPSLMEGSDNSKVIDPGNAGNSLLFKLISHTDEPAMPPKSDKLPDPQIEIIRKWINAHAPETSDSAPVVADNNGAALLTFASEQPGSPPPMPHDLLLEPVMRTGRTGMVVSLAASPRAPIVALAAQKQVLLYNTKTFELAGVLPFPEGFPTLVKFSRDGRLVIAGGGIGAKSGCVVVWDLTTGERVIKAGDEFDEVLAADMSPDHHFIALGGPSRMVKIFRDGKLLYSLKKHTDWVTALAFAADGRLLISGDRQGGLSVWETVTGSEMFTLPPHKGGVTAISAPGPLVCASASEDGTVNLWDLREGKLIKSWVAHKDGVLSLAFAPDGRLVTSGRDKLVRLWKSDGAKLKEFEALNDVALSAGICQENVVASDWSGTVRIWSGAGKRLADLNPNPPTIAEHLSEESVRIATLQTVHAKRLATLADADKTAKKNGGDYQQAVLTSATNEKTKEALPSLAAQSKTAGENLIKAEREMAQVDHDIALAKSELAKWNAAQVNVSLYAARKELEAGQQRYSKAVAEVTSRTAESRTAAGKVVADAGKQVATQQAKVNALDATYQAGLHESQQLPAPVNYATLPH